ncbi:MAG: prolyl oligopeptidase family serine peptidase [Acidobacteria bacterium]|nr:prolyl oligopeptidase family serine peptidase [Acidobacteriota bacterium]
MNRAWKIGVVALALVCFTWSLAAEKKSEWTVEDVLLAESAGQFRVSPDGQWAVWVKTRMDKDKGRRISNLFLSSLTEKEEIQLTRGTDTYRSPRWSPGGRLIAFLSSRPLPKKKEGASRTQLWLINPQGGEPWHLTEFERGIRGFEWKDKDTIVFIAQEDATLYERNLKKEKDTSRVIDDEQHEPPVRIFLLKVKNKKVTRVTENDDWIQGLAVSPDGQWAVTRHERSLHFVFDHKVPPVVFLTNLESGEMKQIAADRRLLVRGLEWAKDSNGFYFTSEYSSDPHYFTASIELLYYYDLASGEMQQVNLQWENGLGGFGGSVRTTEDGFLALMADGVRFRPARYTKRGDTWEMASVTGEHEKNIFSWALGKDGRTLVYNHSTASQPTQWYRAQLNGTTIENAEQLTGLNPNYKGKPLYRTEIVHWKGARDDKVEGVLHYPLNYEEGKKYPLMLSIHGGPSGTDLDAWSQSYSTPKILLAQRGAFVLKVNYHGSGNYGLEWVESICCGNYYDLERVDIENGVDYLIERGLVDPDKLGTMGWSNGAILTTELITRSRRYKVASAGAGDVEWISDWGNVIFGASFDNYYFGMAPYENPEFYIKKSPYFRLKDVTTPTIIYTGTEDVNVPPSQSWSHFRVMQQATETPVKFLVFPGEPHGLRKYQHQKRKLEEDLAWFDRYLFGTYKEPNEAFKEGSPLDVALKSARIQKIGNNYGVQVRKKLVPEVVEHKDALIGRFEVTRAQYAAFDRKYRFDAGTENFPANGISFEQAQAYAAWLSQLTGETYRIPNEDEVRAIYESARGNENTLDHWAGYAPNPDDAERLAKKIAKLEGDAPLLRAAGQFKGRGTEELVFDLGGNVAEWCIGADGSGMLMGGSADQPADPKNHRVEAGEAYRGLRVVRGEAIKKDDE